MSKKHFFDFENLFCFKFLNTDNFDVVASDECVFLKNKNLPLYPCYRLIEIDFDSSFTRLDSNDLCVLVDVYNMSSLVSSIFVKRSSNSNYKLLKVINNEIN